MPNPPKNITNKNDQVTTAQIAAVNKQLKESVKSTDDLANNMKIISKALKDGKLLQEDFNELIDEQVDKYIKAKKLITDISEYSAQFTKEQNEKLARQSKILAEMSDRETAKQQRLKRNAAFEIEYQEILLDQHRKQNEYYNLKQYSEEKTLEALNAQRTVQMNIITDKEVSDKTRQQAIDNYVEALKAEEELEKEQAKLTEDKAWAYFNAEKIHQAEARGDEKEVARLKANPTGSEAGYFYNTQSGKIEQSWIGSFSTSLASKLGDKFDKFGLDIVKSQEKISQTILSGFNSLNAMIDNAARIYSDSYGRVNAAISGADKTFNDLLDGMRDVGVSTLVKQTDLLQNLTDVASQGISADLEQIALLSTIKDKTVASFNSTDSNLRRLVRLNQNLGNLTAKQFGLAAVLRTELNAAFGDSSFIGRQFQSLTGTLLDAISANALKGGTDSTNFYAVLETFAAGMYEAGVDEGTVNSIAQGINYLGSGNVQALSGNKALQNLLLLSLDNAGLDYATIMQQGLTTQDTYLLLQSIVDYLADITDTTKKNNVLQSSYANLFNLSITDMSAIRNLSQMSTFRNMALSSVNQTGEWALNQATNELLSISEERTTFAEALNNFIDNAKFSMGIGVASSQWAYPLNLLSRLGIQAGQTLTELGLTKAGKITTLGSGALYAGSIIPGILNLAENLGGNINAIGNDKNTISNYFQANLGSSGGMYAGTEMGQAITRTPGTNFKGFDEIVDSEGNTYSRKTQGSDIYKESNQWKSDQEAADVDPNTKILKEFEKTLMKANEGEGYAFAVSLQGMSDGVLRSFASIFADEEAMMDTLTGKNNALEQNNTFINYVNDSSTKPTSSNGISVVK